MHGLTFDPGQCWVLLLVTYKAESHDTIPAAS
jgi:hypothetical protein